MATVIASEAVLKVRLDLPKDLPKPGDPGAPPPGNEPPKNEEREPQERRKPNRGGDGPSDGADDGGDAPFSPLYHVKRLGQTALSGGLYSQALATTAASVSFLPGAAGAINAAELVRQYGPAAAAVLRQAATGVTPEGPMRDVAVAAADAAYQLAAKTSDGLSEVRAQLESIGETFQSMKQVAFGQMALDGEIGAPELGAFASAYQSVRAYQLRQESDREQFVMRKIGAGLGDVLAGAAGR